MQWTSDQVLAAAPDAQVAAAGKKLADAKHWRNVGRDDDALWGECQGSALYQVRVALADLTSKCSCPSRKFPCKHAVGLLLLAAAKPVSVASPPGWVAEWIAKRGEKKAPKAEKKEVDAEAQAKRAATRHERVLAGLDALDLWMNDLLRNGLAEVETKTDVWGRQATRLVDAQAPGLATRIRALAAIPGATRDWAERLLGELGRIALLTHAYRRLDQLPAPLQADVRTAIGWTLTEDEVRAASEAVGDEWLVLGSAIEEDDRVRVQRTWLRGARTKQTSMVLQFAAGSAGFGDVLLPGTVIDADLVFWPSAHPQRALIAARRGQRVASELDAHANALAMLGEVAETLAEQPWIWRMGVALDAVVPFADARGVWHVRDRGGRTLPLTGREHWQLLAVSGGRAVGLTGEWDGYALSPLAVVVDGVFLRLQGVR